LSYFSDYTIIKAKCLVGERYDVNFEFDIEEVLKYYTGTHKEGAEEGLQGDLRESQKYRKII